MTTTSGGKIRKVTVDWNTTGDKSILNVYASNSAYSTAADLYGDVSYIGQIKSQTDTELEIDGDYQYVGVRSNDGAIYLKSVTFTWEKSSGASAPRRVVSKSGDADGEGLKVTGITDKEYTVTGLTPGATYDFKVEAVYKDNTTGTMSNVESVTLPTGPTVLVSKSSLAFGEVVTGSSNTLTFDVTGASLTGNVSLAINGDDALSINPTSLAVTDGAVSGTVTVTYAPTAVGAHNATITVSSDGAVSKTVTVTGNAVLEKQMPVLLDATQITGSSFTASWTDATPAANVKSYTLYVNKSADAVVPGSAPTPLVSESFSNIDVSTDGNTDVSSELDTYTDNAGWTGSYVYEGVDGSLKFGSTKNVGSLVSPALDLSKSGGKVTVKFNAKYYGNDGSSVDLWTDDGETSNESVVQALTNAAASYLVVLPCNEAENQYVTLAGTAKKKRFYLYSVEIYAGDVSAQLAAAAPRRVATEGDADNGGLTVTGINAHEYTVTGLTAGATYEFKVKTVYADEAESEFTDPKEVTLLNSYTLAQVLASPQGNYTISDDLRIVAASPVGNMYYATNGTEWLPINDASGVLAVDDVITSLAGEFNGSTTAPVLTREASQQSDATVDTEVTSFFLGQDLSGKGRDAAWDHTPVAGEVADFYGYFFNKDGVPTLCGYSDGTGRSIVLKGDYYGTVDLNTGVICKVQVAIELVEPWSGAPRRIATADADAYTNLQGQVLNAVDDDPILTGVNGPKAHGEVAGVAYYDAAGRRSSQPVDGVNIVVTTYTDGTVTTEKVIR